MLRVSGLVAEGASDRYHFTGALKVLFTRSGQLQHSVYSSNSIYESPCVPLVITATLLCNQKRSSRESSQFLLVFETAIYVVKSGLRP